ncbi:MAG: protein translocase subunit SecD [Holosporales bacterium]|jgi:preprotein translocase subunit SecD|nr:protein translocase subunit SecD [Holosporales bacterium]
MIQPSRIGFATTIAVCMVGIIVSLPTFLSKTVYEKLPTALQQTVNLGLELRGGSHIQLEVDLKSVEKERQENVVDEARRQLRQKHIRYKRIIVQQIGGAYRIIVTLQNEKDAEAVEKLLLKIEQELEIKIAGSEVTATLSQGYMAKFEKHIVDESIEVIRHRIDESGTKEPTILRQGRDRIVVQLPGVEDPAEVKRLLGKTALLTFNAVDEELQSVYIKDGEVQTLPTKPGVTFLPNNEYEGGTLYVPVKNQYALTGKSLIDAQVSMDHQTGLPAVSLKFDSMDGRRKIAELSKQYLGKQFAMVLDGRVLSAPRFTTVLNDGNAQITGNFSMEEATQLALLLRAGSLPAPLTVVEERNVGPSLGADSITHGKNATLFAFLFVAAFMIASYGRFGAFSVITLTANIMLLFACLTLLGATLTLPGIAGIALTIGMAVDSNVLIYERIREEIRHGISAIVAITRGYKLAMTTIVDSNLTTIIGAAVLYEFGSGPIRGFAVTLALGSIISLFTTFALTKAIIGIWMGKNRGGKIEI